MPYSSFIFDESIVNIIDLLKPDTILDIGAGAGKYGHLIKKISPTIKLTALEIEKDYIKNSIYPLYIMIHGISQLRI